MIPALICTAATFNTVGAKDFLKHVDYSMSKLTGNSVKYLNHNSFKDCSVHSLFITGKTSCYFQVVHIDMIKFAFLWLTRTSRAVNLQHYPPSKIQFIAALATCFVAEHSAILP